MDHLNINMRANNFSTIQIFHYRLACRISVLPLAGMTTLRLGFLELAAPALTTEVFSCSATGTGGEEVVMVACGWGDARIGAGLTRFPT